MRAHIGPIVCAAVLLGFAPAPFPKPARPASARQALKELEGSWVAVRRCLAGHDLMRPGSGMTAEFAGERVSYYVETGSKTEWTITLDVGKDPRVFDQKQVNVAGGEHILWGVYRLEGDTLTICYRLGKDPRVRPRSLEGKGPGEWVEEFRRRKR
jgi:uncharacterized protein (TIGR03067 family)